MSRHNAISILPFIALLLIGILQVPAHAGGFTIMPVRLELSAERRVGAFTIRNDADSAVTVDVRAVEWTQSDTGDDYAPTRDIVITPAIFSLAPGASQIVRVGLRRNADAVRELAYRLFFTEIPSSKNIDQPGVAMTLRLSVPLFLHPTNTAQPDLSWGVERDDQGALHLRAHNRGNCHVQVANLQLRHGSRLVARQPTPAYLLPGRAQRWPLRIEDEHFPERGPLTLEGYSDAGDLRVEITLP